MAPNQATIGCRDHPNAPLVEDHRAGDMICTACGLVVGDRVVDVSQEWRTFSDSNNDPSRVGASENPLLDTDLSTMIGAATGPAGLDDQGNPRYRNRGMMSSENRSLAAAFRDIDNHGEHGRLPRTIKEHAKMIYKQTHDKNKEQMSSRTRLPVVAAALFIACREENSSRSYKELCTMTGITQKKLTRAIAFIEKTIGKRSETMTTENWMESYMPRNCTQLGLSTEIARVASHIANKSNEIGLTLGRSHISVAAAAICIASLASDIKKPLKIISEGTGCAEGTLKQVYRLMHGQAAELLPPDFEPAIPLDQLPQL